MTNSGNKIKIVLTRLTVLVMLIVTIILIVAMKPIVVTRPTATIHRGSSSVLTMSTPKLTIVEMLPSHLKSQSACVTP